MIVDHLGTQFTGKNIAVACIYLNHKEVDNQTPSRLLAGLWRQLVLNRKIGSIAEDLYKQHKEKGTAPSLEEVGNVLKSSITEFSKVFIIIDALDEYPEFQRDILLQQLAVMGSNVNLMITSRPNISLEPSTFPNLERLDIHAMEDDLRNYVDAQINSSPQLRMHVQSQPVLREEILQRIIDTVDGM
jgi:Cdc6-like AAA superfamily ATPase